MKFDFIFFLLLAMVFILFALWYCTHLILGAISDLKRNIDRELYDKACDVERQVANLRWNIMTSSDDYWLAMRLREEADSRL